MRTKQFGLFFGMIFALAFLMSAVSAATIAEWNFEGNTLSPSVNITAANLTLSPGLTGPTFPAGNAPSAGASMSSSNWVASDQYIEIDLSTSGFENMILKFDEQRSATGPSAFKIQYSSDGTVFTDLLPSTTSTASSFTTNPMHTFDFSTITAIDNNVNTKLRIVVPSGSTASDAAGTLRVDNLKVEGTLISSSNTIPQEVTACSATGNPGQLGVKKISFENNGMQFGSFGNDDEWFPLEEIEVEIEIENDGANDVDDISVEWGLWNTRTGEWVIDIDEEDEISLNDGDEDSLLVTFTIDNDLDVDLEDLDDGNNYRLYVVATGTVDSASSQDTCVSDFESASIIIESNFVVLDNFQIPETVQCGETVQVSADVWNIGDNDQDEVSVEVFGRENVLAASGNIPIGDMDAFDEQPLAFTFTVPRNLEEKFYALTFQVEDEDGDVYQNDFDDDDSEFIVPFEVDNCGTGSGSGSGSGSSSGAVTIAASLVSGGTSGENLVVRATITNNEAQTNTYQLSAAGFTEWASSASFDANTIVLNAGQSKDVVLTLKVDEDVGGDYTFFIETTSDNEVVRQPVSVKIEPKSRFGITGGSVLGANWTLWTIGLLNLILVIIIIIVAVRIAKKK